MIFKLKSLIAILYTSKLVCYMIIQSIYGYLFMCRLCIFSNNLGQSNMQRYFQSYYQHTLIPTLIQKYTCTPTFTAAVFTVANIWKQPKCPSTDEWLKKMLYTFILEYYSAIKKNEIIPFAATQMDLEIIILSEVSQTEKDKYHTISLICGI